MASSIARAVAWIAGGFLALSGAVLIFQAEADRIDRWNGIGLIALALLFGCLIWLVADLWDAHRDREQAEQARREREYEQAAAGWPRDPSAR